MFKEITEKMAKIVFGKNGGTTESEIKQQSMRDKLSDFLPYLYYNDEDGSFLNIDNTIGYVWECVPYNFQSETMTTRLKKLLELNLPKDSVYSFHLYADPHITPILDKYTEAKESASPLARKSGEEYANYLKEAINGLKKMSDIPVRNFRVFISIKSESKLRDDQLTSIEESLTSCKLSPWRMNRGNLTEFIRRFISGKINEKVNSKTSQLKPLRKQMIEAGTKISFPVDKECTIGKRYGTCLTYFTMPNTTDTLTQNKLLGGFMGVEDDGNQITSPFMFTVVLTEKEADKEITDKAKIINGQQVVGKSAKELNKRMKEYRWILDKKDIPEKLMHVQQTMWVFDTDKSKLRRSVARIKRLAEDYDYKYQEETDLKATLFILSLPMGFYNIDGNVQLIDRYTILPTSSIACILPMQADYSGSIRTIGGEIPAGTKAVMLSVGRKGQIQSMDVFDERSNNHNFLVCAGSGAGKSFYLNKLVNDYYSSGSLVRMVDIGYSFEKSCRMNKGRFLDIGKERIVINPFFSQGKDEEDTKKDLGNCALVLAEMMNSASGDKMDEIQWSLLKQAINFTVKAGNLEEGIDSVQNYLYNLKEYEKNSPITGVKSIVESAIKMAYNIEDFTTKGQFGSYFNGKNTFNIASDDFVVLELQQLKEIKELFSVMVMQVVNAVTQDLYLSDRGRQRFVLFEEAAHYLKQQGHKDLERLAMIIEEGYRRARKHNGAFGAVLQSILDLESFGSVGKVLRSNAEYKFYLQSEDYAEGAALNLIPHKGLALELLSSVKNAKPRYSEVFYESSLGRGVGRLCLDDWNYWVNTSSGKEVDMYDALIKQGLSPEEAISRLSGIRL
ncbi:MAG: TraC family protein [Alteromonadaceae bacterium]|nr:TraC family protein [Alteromonadaceae bacterium]